MKYLKIQNDGVLDIRLVALMGGTTKAHDKYKIGQFGTGLKYTLAYLFRNNLSFRIFAGNEEVKVHTEKELIKGELFEIICINGQRTSITTRMGEDWLAWMIIRELWCNALDEGGAVKEITETVTGEEGKTCFYIQVDSVFNEVLKNWNRYFIHDVEPMFSNENVAIYPPNDHLMIYKQGVLIFEMTEEKSVFSYDIKDAQINELREFKGVVSRELVHAISQADVRTIQYFLEHITEDHFEGGMDYEWWATWGNQWKEAIGTGKLIYPKVLNDLKARGHTMDDITLIVVPKPLFKILTAKFEGIGAVTMASKMGAFVEDHNIDLENKIKQALVILESCDYWMHPELVFKYGWFEDGSILAQVNFKEKTIYVSVAMLQRNLSEVVAMLIEENEHFNTRFDDCTRAFQQHFINLYTRELLAKNAIEI